MLIWLAFDLKKKKEKIEFGNKLNLKKGYIFLFKKNSRNEHNF
jgi:hypothetical protein